MTTNLYAVYDFKAECYGAPFLMQKDVLAQRAFGSLVNDPQSKVHQYPGDFKLYRIGTFDDTTGLVVSTEFVSLGVGSEFVKKE